MHLALTGFRIFYEKKKKNANQAEASLMNFLESTVHAVKLYSLFCITLPFLHIEILSFSFKNGSEPELSSETKRLQLLVVHMTCTIRKFTESILV